MELTRRDLMKGILLFGAAPAIVRASSLMPIKPVIEHGILLARKKVSDWPLDDFEEGTFTSTDGQKWLYQKTGNHFFIHFLGGS